MPTAIARSPEPLPIVDATSWQDSGQPKPDNSVMLDGLFQLLGLVAERGSGGIVDKFIINQNSIGRLVETIAPGAYKSITRIDFSALDKFPLKPVGIYGSETALVDFLAHLGVDIHHLHMVGSRQKLPTGLYFVPSGDRDDSGALRGYVLYWPEPTTWDDNAAPTVKRNRVTFMRYLTKITHQLVCLISEEHSVALVWKDENHNISSKGTNRSAAPKLARRVWSFGVQKTNDQRESVTTLPGSTIEVQEDSPKASFSPRLVAGETRQALISGEEVPARWLGKKSTKSMSRIDVEALMKDTSRTIELSDELSEKATSTLLNMGLRERHSDLIHEWRRDVTNTRTAKDDSVRHWSDQAREALAADLGRLKNHIKIQAIAHVAATYTWLGEEPFEPIPPTSSGSEGVIQHHLEDLDTTLLNFASFNRIDSQHFQLVKSRFITATSALQDHLTSPAMFKRLDAAVVTGTGYYSIVGDLLIAMSPNPPTMSLIGRIKNSFRHIFKRDHRMVKELVRRAGAAEDTEFLNTLETLNWRSHMPRSCSELFRLASQWLSTEVETYASTTARQISDGQLQSALEVSESAIALRFKDLENERFNEFKRDLNNAEKARQPCELLEVIHSLSEAEVAPGSSPTDNYKLSRTSFATDPPHSKYKVQPVGLTADDIQSITADPEIVPRPVVLGGAKWGFRLPDSSSLKTIQIFNNGRYLVIVVDKEESKARFYLESDTKMGDAIAGRKSAFHIELSRIGTDFLVAVDESNRLVGILSKLDNRLHIYTMDESFTVLRPRDSELDIFRLAKGSVGTNIMDVAFIPSKDEIVLVDDTGTSRILSLTSESLRPGVVQLPAGSHSIMSSPDGTCIFLTTVAPSGEVIGVKACHSASFGISSGFDLDLAPVTVYNPQLTSFVTRSNAYLVFSSPGSTHLYTMKVQVTTTSSDFSIKEQFSSARKSAASGSYNKQAPKHNSLLDCHADVWGRYPVAATISRASPLVQIQVPSICFVTSQYEKPFASYFRDMIRDFEVLTKKPTGGLLGIIKVSTMQDKASILSGKYPHVSTFPAGLWLIELLCLIPLHLAVADGNAFVPLKDGVRSSDFERALLGLNHVQVADRITIGWYESILDSYYAKRPIRVVSSMGEQSVGKSYALNHLVDTTFAGSAMRCTEGAWLSVTPTEHELVVALDFEGIHSVERTPQEDMLLVLFNVAISNLVLFRNNFALSRDVAGMFTSFQSSAALLGDPASHHNLFQSSLAIIIKDVVDVDTDEIAKEFADKFRRIVRDKQGENFITTLHRGQLDIIPWPVIQSKEFYTQMSLLRDKLEGKPSTHGNAATFLRTLKLLMARLKASDWASLDPNLAEGRMTILMDSLVQVLSRGYIGDDPGEGQLKNLDTRQPIDTAPGTPHVFSLASDNTLSTVTRETRFTALVADYSPKLKRQQVAEADHLDALNKHLRTVAKMRIRKVQDWVKTNIARFPSDQPAVQKLITQFEKLKKELMNGIEVCGGTCELCRLLCLRPKHHDGAHNCTTDHRCIQLCAWDGKVTCGFSAGHDGRHICDVKAHLCGELCSLPAKKGCLKDCSKGVGHDGEHICEAPSHACGQPCRLGDLGLCKLTCAIDCRKPHDRHICEDRFKCPAKCQLCDRLCATPDHGHPLEKNALHLCGREHPCDKWCEAPGMCDVNPTALRPDASAGRSKKHSRKATKRACAHKIPPNKLKHEGQHVHSVDPSVFHFCGERNPSGCKCVCELPLDHPQDHSTGHGALEQTTWKKAEGRTSVKSKGSKGWFS